MTSKPKALAILIGAGPTSGLGIARTLVQNGYGVACLARNADRLEETVEKIRQQTGQKAVEGFATDTQPSNLTFAFEKIRSHPSFEGLKLKLALFHIKHSSREPFLETSPESYGKALEEYNVGAFAFAQQVLKRVYEESGGQTTLKESGGEKKCTLIFTGTVSAFDLREVGWQHGKS
jgi:short-subunit dehydrogenase